MTNRTLGRCAPLLLASLSLGCSDLFGLGGAGGSGGAAGDTDPYGEEDGWDTGDSDEPEGVPAECIADADERGRIGRLYDRTEDSVHELVTCGGMMVSLASSLKLGLLATNDDLLSEESRADLVPVLEAMGAYTSRDFDHRADGSWAMPAGTGAGSWFYVWFHDPENGQVVKEDLFDLDAYLEGVSITSTYSLDDMVQNPVLDNEFVFNWEREGPLAHLMNDGNPVPQTFALRLSLSDLVLATDPGRLGPFASVLDVEMIADIQVVDDRGDVRVTYDADTAATPVSVIAASSRVDYELTALRGTLGGLALPGDAEDLRFVSSGLAGRIHYTIEGSSAPLSVTSEFGDGSKYPEPDWDCTP